MFNFYIIKIYIKYINIWLLMKFVSIFAIIDIKFEFMYDLLILLIPKA